MEPKDLKNSNEELRATPQENGAAATSQESQGLDTETKKSPDMEPDVEKVSSPAEGDENALVEAFKEPEAADQKETDGAPEVSDQMEINGKQETADQTEPVTLIAEDQSEPEEQKIQEREEVEPEETYQIEDYKEDGDEEELDEETASAVIAKGKIDYSGFSEVELLNALRELISKSSESDIKDEIDRIRINFNKKHQANIEEEKKRFLAEGGVESDFTPSNSVYEDDLKNLLKEFRQVKSDHVKMLEEEKERNLRIKYEIIEEIKSLVNRKESINKTFQEFRDLQQRWRDTGLVPQSKLKDLWETYHHHIESFYDFIKINKELRDLDLKKNLEAKILICEKAEELLVEPSTIKAFNTLQKLHSQWREIGPAPRDKKDEIWDRFKAATSKINKKHQEYFEERKDEQKKNLEAKVALCEKVEEIASLDPKTHKEWDEKSRELVELQKVWRTIGFTPRKENNRIYERFRRASDKFFDAKREFYSQNKELQVNNLQLKTDLCVQAEALKENTDWKKATDEFIRIQKKWKEIGPVPRKVSDAIWKRFRNACDYFFEQKSKHFSDVDHDQVENLRLKRALIKEVKNYELSRNEDADLDQMKEFQRRWTEIGHVPFKEKDSIQNEFRDAVNALFDHLKIDDQKRNLLKFRTKMSNFSTTGKGMDKLHYEREKYAVKLKQLENDLALLNNNIGFFANTKNAESLIDDVNRKINNAREKIDFLKEKIRIIDAMEDED